MATFTLDLYCSACGDELELVSSSKDTKFEGRFFFACNKVGCGANWILRTQLGRIQKQESTCGTYAGYKFHIKSGTKPCEACLEAETKYMKSYKGNMK